MGRCDLCGREDELFKARVEGSLVDVCERCGRFGSILGKITAPIPKKIKISDEFSEDFIVENFNKIIRVGREKKRLTQEELAKEINEKVSVIQKIENREIEPNFNLVKKLEKYFGIILIEKQQLKKEKIQHHELKSFTLGDLVHEKQKRTG